MISLTHVAAGYQPKQEILRDVSMALPQGSFHFLAGPSGVGKTTLLALISLRLKPLRGCITMFGRELTRARREELPQYRRRIGLVSQDYRLLPHLSVEENIGLPLKVAGEPAEQIRAHVAEMLDWVGLKDYPKARPAALSGGQQQRVAIARAVITKPDLLLCDEPSGHLDATLAMRFMYLFEALNMMGTTVLFATHDDHLMDKFGHPVLRLKDGVLT